MTSFVTAYLRQMQFDTQKFFSCIFDITKREKIPDILRYEV